VAWDLRLSVILSLPLLFFLLLLLLNFVKTPTERTAGLGTTDRKADALGGDMYWAGGLSLLTPIPIPSLMKNDMLKLHFFANGGNLIQTDEGASLEESARKVMSNTDVAVGLGFALRSPAARLEINYCVPVLGKNADIKNRKFYIGIGFDFL
jgi:outer membrane protein insertion porin family